MSLIYKNVVFLVPEMNLEKELVWCEFRVRIHTLSELRYQVRVFEASEEYSPNLVYRKGISIADSSWEKTPKKAREDVEEEVGELKRDNIKWQEWIGEPFSIPIIREDF
ncbi:hypothetical protein [Peribacillus deserti]|uniref:Uncharacterized protein n=1 Tax=Peribacillus deserti TaxID=673318 RepID=A0A2N5M1E9_9BACI|nr:hypothetical protein [Peribacillus deserti]PLT28180.1 hypothetical protein CUU66_19755 [Peribacillus deserti]